MTSTTGTGIVCSCGSAELRVVRTTPARGFIVRRRQCVACGARITTTEREIHTAPATNSGLATLSIGQIRESLDLLADLTSGNSAASRKLTPEQKGT